MKTRIFSGFGTALAAMLLLFSSCSKSSSDYGSSNNPPPSSGNTVDIYNSSFKPTTLTVKPGTTVTWTNSDSYSHTVTADDNSFDSGTLGAGKTYSRTFSTAGSYPYHCNFHSSMKATIVVQ